ncbi:unnamed protein product [Lactuca saligna]|uniref:Large ribosomal subunit protein uL16m n=1 Tax=Lactuca saligna TaxID=75948 RepID=A0AA35VIZ7_LACSI|nr:unnamed protein product [Lactuca saligna]
MSQDSSKPPFRSYAKIFIGSRLFLTVMAIHLSLWVAPLDLQQGGNSPRRAIIGQFHCTMSGQFRRNGKIWVRVLADLPITGEPTEVRMGKGKGNPTGWIARLSIGQIPFEMDGVSLSNARQAATLAAHKLCSSTKFVQWS